MKTSGLILVLGILRSGGTGRSIPELSVSVNGESLQVVEAGHRWKSLLRVVCVESENPKVLVKDIEPYKVQKGQLLSLKFSGKPDKIDMYNFTNNERTETTGILLDDALQSVQTADYFRYKTA